MRWRFNSIVMCCPKYSNPGDYLSIYYFKIYGILLIISCNKVKMTHALKVNLNLVLEAST